MKILDIIFHILIACTGDVTYSYVHLCHFYIYVIQEMWSNDFLYATNICIQYSTV